MFPLPSPTPLSHSPSCTYSQITFIVSRNWYFFYLEMNFHKIPQTFNKALVVCHNNNYMALFHSPFTEETTEVLRTFQYTAINATMSISIKVYGRPGLDAPCWSWLSVVKRNWLFQVTKQKLLDYCNNLIILTLVLMCLLRHYIQSITIGVQFWVPRTKTWYSLPMYLVGC